MLQFRHIKAGENFKFIDDEQVYQKVSLLSYMNRDTKKEVFPRSDFLRVEVIKVDN